MAKLIKLYERLFPILKIVNSGVSDIKIIKESYTYICDKEWNSSIALEKSFSRDIKLLVASGLIFKEKSYIYATERTKNLSKLPNNFKKEVFRVYINSAHMFLLDGEYEETIDKNLQIYDQLFLGLCKVANSTVHKQSNLVIA